MIDQNVILELAKEGIFVVIYVAGPLLMVALFVGLLISLFQALTQIQEATLSFVPKILAIFFTSLYLMPYLSEKLRVYFEKIIEAIT